MILRWNPASGHLSISEELLEQLHHPHVLIIERVGERGLVLYQRGDARATGKERKVNYPQRAMPRLKIGLDRATELGLRKGRYDARIIDNAIVALPAGD